MDSELWAAAIGGGAGLATGAVSSLLAPWAKWSIEKRQVKMQHRLAILKEARRGVAEYRRVHTSIVSESWYQQLRPYMTSAGIASIEAPRVPSVTALGQQELRHSRAVTLAGEIDRVERDWKLNK